MYIHDVQTFFSTWFVFILQTFQRSSDRIGGILSRIVGRNNINRSALQF